MNINSLFEYLQGFMASPTPEPIESEQKKMVQERETEKEATDEVLIRKQMERLPLKFSVFLQEELTFPLEKLYDIKSLATKGNFSTVRKAKYLQNKDGTQAEIGVVAKVLQQEDVTYSFVELALLRGLSSPYIIGFIGGARDPITRQPVLIMEYMDRGDVKTALAYDVEFFRKPIHAAELSFNWKQRFRVAKHAMLALDALHSNHVMHRDIKADNLFLHGRGAKMLCKLGDFGFARGINHHGDRARRTLTICGTEALMAPEMHLDLPYSFGADVFSYGCVLIELICGIGPGRPDFIPRTRQNSFEVDFAQVKEAALPGCPESLLLLAEQCLQYEEDERIKAADAKDWLLELEKDLREKTAERLPSQRPPPDATSARSAATHASRHSKQSKNSKKALRSKEKLQRKAEEETTEEKQEAIAKGVTGSLPQDKLL